jgi:hypothetical protein
MAKRQLVLTALSLLVFSTAIEGAAAAQTAEPPDEESTITTEGSEEATKADEGAAKPEPPPPPVEPEEPAVKVEVIEETPHPELPPGEPEPGEGISLVEASWGRMKLGAVMQAQLLASDIADKGDSRSVEFKLKRMRVILSGGFLKDMIGYYIQGDMVNMAGFLLDARASIRPLKGLEIRFGRFIPDFTYYMPLNVGRLMLIDYPLVTETFAPWRQVGLEIIFSHQYFDIYAGIYNGMRFEPAMTTDGLHIVSSTSLMAGYMGATINNIEDDNMGKDFLFRFVVKPPVKGLELGAYVWYGMPQYTWYDVAMGSIRDDLGNLVHFGAEVRYFHKQFSILAEYAMRRIYYPAGAVGPDYASVSRHPLVANGAYLHMGYRFMRPLEVMLRGDYYDGDLDDEDNGQQIWGTLGLNYYLDDLHARMTLEYVMKAIQRTTNGEDNDYEDHGISFQLCLML